MIFVRGFILIGLILSYGCIFAFQYPKAQDRNVSLETALPVTFYRIASGYLKQLAAEMLFIRTSVFLGGIRPGTPPTSYEETLGNNFEVMTQLYPNFVDPYYFCQGFLAPISKDSAIRTNTILDSGITAHPDFFVFRVFQGTNYFLSINDPLKSAQVFTEGAKLPGAPAMFSHLAAILSAKGGDIIAGLALLKIMHESEENEVVRNRYEKEIDIFEHAQDVQKGLDAYTIKYSYAPKALEQLVPEFLPQLPKLEESFVLIYDPPDLRLQRPDRGKKLNRESL